MLLSVLCKTLSALYVQVISVMVIVCLFDIGSSCLQCFVMSIVAGFYSAALCSVMLGCYVSSYGESWAMLLLVVLLHIAFHML